MPDIDTHVRRGHPIVFSLICVFAIITGCITSFLVGKYNAHHSYPNNSFRDRLRFGVFVSWWTVVFSIGYIVLFLVGSGGIVSSIASHAIWLFVTWIFWTALAGSITHMLGGGIDCGNSTLTYCSQNMAAMAFAWIEWILLTITLILVILLGTRSIRNGDKMSGPLSA